MIRLREAEGKVVVIEVRDPASVCCPEALLAAAIISVNVRQHPKFPFEILEEEINGEPHIRWRWIFKAESEDSLYKTATLVKWWYDPAWHNANAQHEFAIVRRVLQNMDAIAVAARMAVPLIVIRRGRCVVRIPVNATEERRAELLGELAAAA